jgi:hypothetical protein
VQRRAKSHPRHRGPESVLNVLQRVGDSIGTAVLAVILERALVGVTRPAEAASACGELLVGGRHHRAGDRALRRARPRRAHARARGRRPDPGVTEEAIAESVA